MLLEYKLVTYKIIVFVCLFVYLFVSVLPLKIQLSREKCLDHINRLFPPLLYACPIPIVTCHVLYCELLFDVRGSCSIC